jgi:hypothetical protein
MAILAGAVSEMSTLLTDLQWYWDLSSADATITDQHSGLALSRIGTTTTESTGGPDGGPCINFGAAAGKYRNASVAKTVSYDDGFTVNIWVRSTGTSSTGNTAINHRNSSSERYFSIVTRLSTGLDIVFSFDAAGTQRTASDARENENVWQMVSFWDNGAESRIYRNGVLSGTSNTALGTRPTAAAAFAIGGIASSDTIFAPLNHRGQLAMAGVWNEPLSQAAITALYNGGNGRRYADLNIPIGVFPRRRRSRSGGGVL